MCFRLVCWINFRQKTEKQKYSLSYTCIHSRSQWSEKSKTVLFHLQTSQSVCTKFSVLSTTIQHAVPIGKFSETDKAEAGAVDNNPACRSNWKVLWNRQGWSRCCRQQSSMPFQLESSLKQTRLKQVLSTTIQHAVPIGKFSETDKAEAGAVDNNPACRSNWKVLWNRQGWSRCTTVSKLLLEIKEATHPKVVIFSEALSVLQALQDM